MTIVNSAPLPTVAFKLLSQWYRHMNDHYFQYYAPFLNCDLNKMADAFNTDVDSLETELMKLVADQPVKIDSHNRV